MELDPLCVTVAGSLVTAVVYLFKKYIAMRDKNVSLMEESANVKDEMMAELKAKIQELENATKGTA